MREATDVASEALGHAVSDWSECGLTRAFNDLATAVWKVNQDRHETELGDDATTLGTLCARNLANLVESRVTQFDAHGPAATEFADAGAPGLMDGGAPVGLQWAIPGLSVSRPKGALRLSLNGRNFYVMKAPMSAGRDLDWDAVVNWEAESETRHSVARANSEALDHFYAPAHGQQSLWAHFTDAPASALRDFMVVWAGEKYSQHTAGWLTVPGLGDAPFIAKAALWWDDSEERAHEIGRRVPPQGQRFDEKRTAAPEVTLRRRSDSEGEG